MALLDEFDARREQVAVDKENAGRLAHCYASFTTTGLGSYQHPKRVSFDITFIEQPFMSSGFIVDVEALADAEAIDDSNDVVLPIITAFVTAWDQDDRDFYVGCWVAVRVYFPSDIVGSGATMPTPVPEIEHHFTFTAIGMKDVPIDYSDEID